MFDFFKKVDVEHIPATKALFNCVSSVFTYGLLIWLIALANFSWFTLLIAFIGILASTLYSFAEDKITLKMEEDKTPKSIILLPLTNMLAFWVLILYLCLNIQLNDSTIKIIIVAFVFSFIRTIASSLFVSPLMKSLKRAQEINKGLTENKFSAVDALEKLEEENKNMKRQMARAILLAFIPAILGVVFLWIAFIRILIDTNAPIQLVLYTIFAVIIEMVLSNFTKKLKKELINKVILKTNE